MMTRAGTIHGPFTASSGYEFRRGLYLGIVIGIIATVGCFKVRDRYNQGGPHPAPVPTSSIRYPVAQPTSKPSPIVTINGVRFPGGSIAKR